LILKVSCHFLDAVEDDSPTLEMQRMDNDKHYWQQAETAQGFVDEIRAAIPLAAEQIEVLLRVVNQVFPKIDSVLDLGCGDGILGRTVLANYPDASGVFLDFSEPMIEAAKQRVGSRRATFFVESFADRRWCETIKELQPFDLVVSGLAIHHLPDDRKKELYGEIFDLLKPGGLFLHLERVSLVSPWSEKAYDEMFVDSLWSHHSAVGKPQSREEIAQWWEKRLDQAEDRPAPLDVQCQWLREIGFSGVDCFFKLFALSLFGGRKPC
jgi:SAM-dependent methyltransferase